MTYTWNKEAFEDIPGLPKMKPMYSVRVGKLYARWNSDCNRMAIHVGNRMTYADHVKTHKQADAFLWDLQQMEIKTMNQLCKAIAAKGAK